jgi:proline racemase
LRAALVDTAERPVYQQIAARARELRELGLRRRPDDPFPNGYTVGYIWGAQEE